MESFLFIAVVAGLVTIPVVRFIPRARQSIGFDIVLWFATWLLAFFMASSAPQYLPVAASLRDFEIAQVAVIPVLIGAAIGALLVNVPLWIIDRFGAPPVDDETETLTEAAAAPEENVGLAPSETESGTSASLPTETANDAPSA